MKLKVTFLLLFVVLSIRAQVTSEQDIKVGVVLSGGGAKGLAHVGALKVLEEAGVRVDYIAGTSMGAIVGGLYASGYNATQLDSLFRAVDFTSVIQDELPRKAKTFYEKEASEKYAISLPFDNFKLSLPQSISKGQNTYNLLIRLLEHVGETEDFAQLPIPFFCIATDIEKAEQVILDTGFLPEALSASSALPTLFKPVTLGDRMLIDGGVVNNYPIDELRAKGVDVIIGIDVQDGLRKRDKLTTAPEIFLQINNYRTIEEMKGKRDSTDVYIRPDVEDFTVVDFDKKNIIIDRGEVEALKQLEALKEIAAKQGTLSRKRIQPKLKDSIRIDAVVLRGNKDYTRSYILGKLQFDLPMTLDYERFSNGINNLSATENFDRIGYHFQKIPEGTLLKFDVQESKSKQSIGLGLHYDDLYRSAALINYTRKRVLFDNDIATFDFILGDNIRYAFNYYIDKGYYWSVGLRSTYNSFDKGVSARLVEEVSGADLSELNRVTLDYQDLTNQLYLQTLFVKQFSLDLGVQHKFLDIETETVDDDDDDIPGSVFEKSHFFGAYGQLRYDSLDNKYFPKSGIYFDGDFDLTLFSSDFNNDFTEFSIANAYFLYAASIAKKWTFLTEVSGGFKIGGEEVRSLDFFLGGYGNKKINNLVPFYGYDFISIAGDGYVKAGFSVDYEFIKKNHFNVGVNIANAGYNLFTSEEWLTRPDFTGYALGYGMDTFLGPLELKYTYSPEIKTGEWFIAVGFQF